MNEQQAKAAFFAMYLAKEIGTPKGKKLLIGVYVHNDVCWLGFGGGDNNRIWFKADECYLFARSIEQLSDEEYTQVSFLTLYEPEKFKKADLIRLGRNVCKMLDKELEIFKSINIYQYLLRIGIIMPFTYINKKGKVITLQPAEIIAKDWAKIKQD